MQGLPRDLKEVLFRRELKVLFLFLYLLLLLFGVLLHDCIPHSPLMPLYAYIQGNVSCKHGGETWDVDTIHICNLDQVKWVI